MKNIINKYSKYLGLALIAFALFPVTLSAQNKKDKKAEIKNIVETQNWHQRPMPSTSCSTGR